MILYPKEYFSSVKEITIDLLKKNEIKGIILDVDNTLIDFDRKMPDGIKEWTSNLKNNGIQFCIVSNSNKEEKIKQVSQNLDIPYIFFAKKPLKNGFKKAKEKLGLEYKNIAAVGDQIFTDIIGANRCGIYPILVEPIKEKDYLITRIKRPIEKFIIKKYLNKVSNEKTKKGIKENVIHK